MLHASEVESRLGGHVRTRARPGGTVQLFIPVYFEDGDMVPVYLRSRETEAQVATWILTDLGSTLMHLSYEYELDTANKRRIFHSIAAENGLEERDGRLELETTLERLHEDAIHFASTAAKIATMRYFSRAVVENLFFEMLDDFVTTRLVEFEPRKDVVPIPTRDELSVDYVFEGAGQVPLYLFGVNSDTRAKLVTIKLLTFKNERLDFRGFVVHEDLTKLAGRDRKLVTNAADKQFYDFDTFVAEAYPALERERRLGSHAS